MECLWDLVSAKIGIFHQVVQLYILALKLGGTDGTGIPVNHKCHKSEQKIRVDAALKNGLDHGQVETSFPSIGSPSSDKDNPPPRNPSLQ